MVLPHERDSIALAVALANTWDVLNDPPEHLDDVEMLRLILRAFGLHEEARRAEDGDLAPLRAMRDRLRLPSRRPTTRRRFELNALAREAGAIPQLAPENGGWSFRYGVGTRSLVTELAGRVESRSSVSSREGAGAASGSAPPRPAAACSSTARGTGAGATAATTAPTGPPRRPPEGAAGPRPA